MKLIMEKLQNLRFHASFWFQIFVWAWSEFKGYLHNLKAHFLIEG